MKKIKLENLKLNQLNELLTKQEITESVIKKESECTCSCSCTCECGAGCDCSGTESSSSSESGSTSPMSPSQRSAFSVLNDNGKNAANNTVTSTKDSNGYSTSANNK